MVLSVGTKSEMLAVERSYLKGEFTPFTDSSTIIEEPAPTESTKSNSVASPKLKKRKRSTNFLNICYKYVCIC